MQVIIFSADLIRAVDALGSGCLLYECRETPQRMHMNVALREMLGGMADRALLEQELDRLASDLCAQCVAEGLTNGLATLSRQVSTEKGAFQLRATRLASAEDATRSVLLQTIEPLDGDPLDESRLQRRFRLTPREAQLARLLVAGRTNAEIAEALGIKPNTAHHYTERVLLKLGARNRVEVGAKILLTSVA